MTLRIPDELYAAMLAHCRAEHPLEACGVIAGRTNGADDLLVFLRRMRNAHPEPRTRFAFDPDEQLDLYRSLDELGLEPAVIYHSHTATVARPSGADAAHARDPGAHYVIVGTGSGVAEVRSYRLLGCGLIEEPIEILTEAMSEETP